MRRKDREVSDIQTLTDILNKCKTASIAMIDGDMPYVVPLSYGYEIKESTLILYFHCAREGRKLNILHANNKVSFAIFDEGKLLHADMPCNSSYYYSSIIGSGTVEFIENTTEKRHGLTRMYAQQTGKTVEFTDAQTDSVCVFKIISKDYTGKQKAMP